MSASPAEQVLSRMLAECAARSSKGIVTAVRGRLKRLFCVEAGRIVFVASNIVEEQFTGHLLQRGVVGEADMAAARQEADRSGRTIEAVLQEGFVEPDRLGEEMTAHARSLVDSCLAWPDGEFSFDVGTPRLDGQATGDLPIAEVVLRHVRRRPAVLAEVLVRIGPPDTRPVVTRASARILRGVELDAAARYVLGHASGALTVRTLAEQSPEKDTAVIRAIYGLLLLQALESAADDAPDVSVEKFPEVSRDEALGWLSKAEEGDYFQVLGIDRSADMDGVRRAYYALARRMHPDRFRTGPNRDMFDRVERYFTRVTEAYNTLHDPERRKEYEEFQDAVVAKQDETTDAAYLARQNFLKGKALAERRRFSDAVSFFENAIQLDDSQAVFHLELGRLLAKNPRHRARGETHLQRAATLDPALVDTYLVLGDLYVRAGNRTAAARMFREALRWEPGHPEAMRLLDEMGESHDAPEEKARRSAGG